MPKNIPENDFACLWAEKREVIPYWIKSLDIDECNDNIVVHFNSEKYFQYLSKRIADHDFCSDTDEAPADTYEITEDTDLNTITFTGNLYDALHFIISHGAISQDTYKSSVEYLKNCSYKQEDMIHSDPENSKVEKNTEISTNKPGQFIRSSLKILSYLFTKPKAKDVSATSNKINSTLNKPFFK